MVSTTTSTTTTTTTTTKTNNTATTTNNITNNMGGNFLTRSKPFRLLVDKAFTGCDVDQTGHISKTELYSGLLFVHLNLAKYTGPAACYPPSRAVVDHLFDVADTDQSGTIDKDEFVQIIGIACGQILGRMIVYYLILILFVPILTTYVVDHIKMGNPSTTAIEAYGEEAAEQVIGLILFFVIIPILWNYIDQYSEYRLLLNSLSSMKVSSSTEKVKAETTMTSSSSSSSSCKEE